MIKKKTQGQPSSSSPNSPWNDKRNTDVEHTLKIH